MIARLERLMDALERRRRGWRGPAGDFVDSCCHRIGGVLRAGPPKLPPDGGRRGAAAGRSLQESQPARSSSTPGLT
jgi:hypothetical protein